MIFEILPLQYYDEWNHLCDFLLAIRRVSIRKEFPKHLAGEPVKFDSIAPNPDSAITPVLILQHASTPTTFASLPHSSNYPSLHHPTLHYSNFFSLSYSLTTPSVMSFLDRPQNLNLKLVCGGKLFHQLVADIAVLRVRFAVFGEEFDIMLFQAIVILERPESEPPVS